MKKFGRKALALSLTVVLGTSMMLSGCGKDGGNSACIFWYRCENNCI